MSPFSYPLYPSDLDCSGVGEFAADFLAENRQGAGEFRFDFSAENRGLTDQESDVAEPEVSKVPSESD